MHMIQIQLNGDDYPFVQDGSLTDLLESLDLTGKRIAIEVNQTIIPRSQHADYIIQKNDRIEIIHAVGGG